MRHETLPVVVEILMKGRAKVDADWCQYKYGQSGPSQGYCALTALLGTWKSGVFEPYKPFNTGFVVLTECLPPGNFSVIRYNDDPTTTKEDILALYDRAIALALAS